MTHRETDHSVVEQSTEPQGRSARERLRAGVLEVLVIALGILLAFSVDAWWEGVQERTRLAQELAAVEIDLRLSLESISRAIQDAERIAAMGHQLLSITGPDSGAEEADLARSLLARFIFTPTSRLNAGAVSSLLATGHLSDLDDPQLQSALARLPADFVAMTALEEEISRLMKEAVFPRTWLFVPQLDAELVNGLGGGATLEEFRAAVPQGSRFEADYAGLLGDLQFENAVVERTTLTMVTRRIAIQLEAELSRVLELLDARR